MIWYDVRWHRSWSFFTARRCAKRGRSIQTGCLFLRLSDTLVCCVMKTHQLPFLLRFRKPNDKLKQAVGGRLPLYAPAPLLPLWAPKRLAPPSRPRVQTATVNTFPRSPLQLPDALTPWWVERPGDLDLLTLKAVSELVVTWATSVPILIFLCISVLELRQMYATDRQTDVKGRHQTNISDSNTASSLD